MRGRLIEEEEEEYGERIDDVHSSSLHLGAARPSFLVTVHITPTNKLYSGNAEARSSYMSNHLDGKSYRCGAFGVAALASWYAFNYTWAK